MKEEWRSAAMECGGLSGMEGGTVLMLLLLVGSLDCISHTLVCSHDKKLLEAYFDTNFFFLFVTGVDLLSTSYFGSGSGPILFSYLNCDGTESRLSDCSTSNSYYFGASHSSDAGVRCQPPAVTSKHIILGYFLCSINLFILTEFLSSIQLCKW